MVSALQSQLFPSSQTFLSGFTTSPYVNMAQIAHVSLTDSALGVTKVSAGTDHPVVAGPATDENVWKAIFPKGSYVPSSGNILGGFGFYLAGPPSFSSKLSTAKEVLMSYSVRFETNWEWQKGGKLPGQYGGVGDLAYGCSGGRQESRDQCFDLRFMWRAGGAGEVYAYLPLTSSNSNRLGSVPPQSIENPDYGFSVARGAWTFHRGAWNVIAERIRLNDPSQNNGILQVWVNGSTVVHVTGLSFRNSSSSMFRGMHFQTFFGGKCFQHIKTWFTLLKTPSALGSTPDYASPQTQVAWFADISGAIIS